MTVLDIVKEYLIKNKYDGLYGFYCGCSIDDLMPCCWEGTADCEPGHKVPCDCGEGCEYHIKVKE